MTAHMSERKCTQLSPLNQIMSTTCFARGEFVYKLYINCTRQIMLNFGNNMGGGGGAVFCVVSE